jgi:hypothetical protein
MRFEPGQTWRTRGGGRAYISRVDEPGVAQIYSVFGVIDEEVSESWTDAGLSRMSGENPNDLIELLTGSHASSSDSREYFVELMSRPVRGMW